MTRPLTHPLLRGRGVAHGFGVRGAAGPADPCRPRQVHGARVVSARECRASPPPEADAVVSEEAGVSIAVATADCVPILLSARGGEVVAAVHAGWRGLAQGVVEAGVDALRQAAGLAPGCGIAAAIGPHIGACCYEIDEPVTAALETRFGEVLPEALRHVGSGRAMLDLGAVTRRALERAGVSRGDMGLLRDACTRCDAERFHSHRRDGPRAGRMLHFISARAERLDRGRGST